VAGYGDPKALGWVSRVVGRTTTQDADLTAYNLGVRDDSSADVMQRWRSECAPRWAGRSERRLVVGVGARDVPAGVSTARSRLNLANVLDEAATSGIATFVVGPTPTLDADTNARIEVLAGAQADVCDRRNVPFVDCFRPLVHHDQWLSDLAAGDGVHPGQAGYGLIAWLVLHYGWQRWLQLQD
jgi:lysophospholipase L1-like esterase